MLTPEEVHAVIDRGLKAKELLEHPAFLDTVNDLSNYHLSALTAAPPGEQGRDARDHHHLLHYALIEVVNDLRARAQAGEELERQLASDTEEEDL